MSRRLLCIAVVLSMSSFDAEARPTGGGQSLPIRLQLRRSVIEAREPSSTNDRGAFIERLPALYRSQVTTAGSSGAISPPNVRLNDPTRGQNRDTQSMVSIAAWGDDVVAIWLDATLDDQGQLPLSLTAYAYSCDKGATFTDGGVISGGLYDDAVVVGELTADGQGNFYAVLNMQHGLDSGNPLGYTADVHAVWRGQFNGCSFSWSAPTEVTSEPADSVRYLDYPHAVADPEDGTLYVAYSRTVANLTNQMEVATSTDGGATWSAPKIIQQAQPFFMPDDPRLAVGPNHEVYIAWSGNSQMAIMSCDNSNLFASDRILFTRSFDHGATWRPWSTIAPEYANHYTTAPGDTRGRDLEVPSIAVDRSNGPQRGTVYVAWAEAGQWEALAELPDTVQEAEPNGLPIGAARFILGGAGQGTWPVSNDVDFWKIDLQAGDDVLFFLHADDWTCTGTNTSSHTCTLRLFPEPLDLQQPPDTLLSSSIIDFWACRIVFSCRRTGTYYLRTKLSFLDEGTNVGYTLSARRIHFLDPAPEAPARDERDIVLVRSLDQGTSWSAKSVVNWDSPPRYSESLPCLTVDDTGALAAFWYDRRQTEAPDAPVGEAILTDVYMNQSLDGVSFSPARRVTDESSLFLGVPTTGWNVGDFQSAFANGRDIYLGWTDGRSSNTATSGIDAYANRVVRPRSKTSSPVVQFPRSTEGDSVHAEVGLSNHGATPLQVTGISVPFGAMTVTPSPPFQIPVDGTMPLSFDVRSITTGDSSGVVRIQSSDPFDSLLSLPVVARPKALGFQIVSEEFFREPVVVQSQDIPVIVVMDDSVHVDSLWVYYRTGGAPSFSPLALTPVSLAEQPARYRAFIPTDAVGPRGLEFFVAARNGGATSYRPSPSQPVRFQVRVGDLALPAQAPDAYRMISVPLDCEGATVMDLFGDDLGPADPAAWRLFALGTSTPEVTQYRELAAGDTTQIPLGGAYWLITRDGLPLDTSPAVGMSTPTSADYVFPLNGTWNMIGSPFDFPVAWADVRVDGTPTTDQGLVEAPMQWNPATKTYQPTDLLMPFEGYFVKRNGSSAVSLAIPPLAQSTALSTSAIHDGLPNDAWELTLRISGGTGSDAVSVGVSPLGRSDHDRLDASHPPPAPGDGVWAAIPHADWGDYRGSYWRDVREPLIEVSSASSANGHRWPLSVGVHSDRPQQWTEMTLAVDGLERIPSGFQAVLVDEQLGRGIDLRANHEYRFVESASTGVPEPRFHLLIGTAAFIEQGGTSSPAATNRLSDAAPNPFQTNTMIRYEVGAREPVDLAIFDVQGRRVKTLAKGPQPPGIYEVVWSGASERGASVGAGLYFVRLDAGGHSFIRKLLKVGSTAR